MGKEGPVGGGSKCLLETKGRKEGENGAGGPLRKGMWTEVKEKCKDQPRATICH